MTSFSLLASEQAREFFNEQQPVILDIRDAASFQQGHIPNAIHMPSEQLADFASQQDKQQTVVVCCYHGNSSKQVAKILCEQGFANVYSLEGGYHGWQDAAVND